MAMLRCPHCDGPGISTARKLYLGPAIPATCRTCGRKIGVPYGRSLLAMLPLFVHAEPERKTPALVSAANCKPYCLAKPYHLQRKRPGRWKRHGSICARRWTRIPRTSQRSQDRCGAASTGSASAMRPSPCLAGELARRGARSFTASKLAG